MSFIIFMLFSSGIFGVLYWYIKYMNTDGEEGVFGMQGDIISSKDETDAELPTQTTVGPKQR